MTKNLLIPVLSLALASLLLVACGDSGDSSDSSTEQPTTISTGTDPGGDSGGATVDFAATDGIAYTETEVSAPAGSDTIAFDNPGSIPHNVVIEDADGNGIAETEMISAGTTETEANLEPGTYTFYCSVSNHRDLGMEGTLTIK